MLSVRIGLCRQHGERWLQVELLTDAAGQREPNDATVGRDVNFGSMTNEKARFQWSDATRRSAVASY